MSLSLPAVVLITGTSTEVGKTIATAALACALRARGTDVAVVKLAQTGVTEDEEGDAQVVARLTGGAVGGPVHTQEFLRLPEPLAPDTAARRAGIALPPVASHLPRIGELTSQFPVVLVEGSGGLLVRLDERGGTLADLGVALRYKGTSCGVVLVAAAGLGTLNHSALTAEALRHRDLPLLGSIVGSWPDTPGLAEECNLMDLPRATGAAVLGRLPNGAGALPPAAFAEASPRWLPTLSQ